MTPQTLMALRYLPRAIEALGPLGSLVGKINDFLQPPPDEEEASADDGQDEQTVILRELRTQESQRLAVLREVKHKEDELLTLYRQVRENESELISLFERIAESEDEQTARLSKMGQSLQDLIALIEAVGNRKQLLAEELASWRRDGYEIESQSEGQAIVGKGGLFGIGRERKRVTIDDYGQPHVDSP